MQEKKNSKKLKKKKPPKNCERERERETTFFVRENNAQNGRDSDKFIVKGVNKKRQKYRKMKGKRKNNINVEGSGKMKR